MENTVARGDVFYANLERGIGSEQKGYHRPVIIVQNEVGNRYSPTVVVVPVTSKVEEKAPVPTHYRLRAFKGLKVPSMALAEQITTIDKTRLRTYIGRLEEYDMIGIERALAVSIGLRNIYYNRICRSDTLSKSDRSCKNKNEHKNESYFRTQKSGI